jgi:Uma2 family endonuclease
MDLAVKRRAYAKFGFGEYWVIDPDPETVQVFRGSGDWLEPAEQLSRAAGSQTLVSPLFPGLVLNLDQIFA